MSRPDLLKLVSMLEGELQAREIVIAVLKSEQIKKLLNPTHIPISGFKSTKQLNKCNTNATEVSVDQTIKYSTNPLVALSRDSFAVYEPSLDYATTLALFNIKFFHLENLIHSQNKLRNDITQQLKLLESRYEILLKELEDEKSKNKKYELENYQNDKAKEDSKLQALNEELTETKDKMKQIVLGLLEERKHLILELIEEKHQNDELENVLTSEKGKIAEMVEGLEDESKRSLQMEAELEKYLSDFEKERNELKKQLQMSETKNLELMNEMEKLKNTVDSLENQLSNKSKDNLQEEEKWKLGEGVRSSIVTMPAGPKVHSLSNPVFHPKASLAQPITKNVAGTCANKSIQETNPNIILPPPSIPVPVPKQSQFSALKFSSFFLNQNSSIIPTTTTANTSKTNENTNSIHENDNLSAKLTKCDTSVKQTVLFYENSANQNKTNTVTSTNSTSTTSITTTNNTPSGNLTSVTKKPGTRQTPPPIPPNKPSIKPVLPNQALFLNKTTNNAICKTNSQNKSINNNPANNAAQTNSVTNVSKKS